jgi:hypothetical protein
MAVHAVRNGQGPCPRTLRASVPVRCLTLYPLEERRIGERRQTIMSNKRSRAASKEVG